MFSTCNQTFGKLIEGMARPIHADAEATRRRILATAVRLFSDRGIGAASVRMIAAESKVSVAMVHHYFGNKAGLYRACVAGVDEEIQALRRELEPAFLEARQIDDMVEIAVRRAYAFARRRRSAVLLLMRNVLDTGALEAVHREEVLLPFLERGSSLLAPLLGRPVEEVRLTLLSIVYLIVRFALNTPEEQARITAPGGEPDHDHAVDDRITAPGGEPDHDHAVEDPDRAVEDHLVVAARALLAASAAPKTRRRSER
jgi:AcrR family transcriptional regulator